MKAFYNLLLTVFLVIYGATAFANTAKLKYRVIIENTSSVEQKNVPVTFGQVFLEKDIPNGSSFKGYILESAQLINVQVDKKATHNDGSLRHGVFSAIIPSIPGNGKITLETAPSPVISNTNQQSSQVSSLLDSGFDARIALKLATESGGGDYSLSFKDAAQSANNVYTWLDGPVVTEWMIKAPLKANASGKEHPHLYALIYVRKYHQTNDIRLDTVVENSWTYEPNPRNFTYDASIELKKDANSAFATTYNKSTLEHFNKTRWRRLAWSSDSPKIHLKHDSHQLINSKAIPYYNPSLIGQLSSSTLTKWKERWTAPAEEFCYYGSYRAYCSDTREGVRKYTIGKKEPMGKGFIEDAMAKTGGRYDIGPLPAWTASYIINQDELTKDITLTHGDQAGSFPVHYREKATGRIINSKEHPHFSIKAVMATIDPKTNKRDMPAPCDGTIGECRSPYAPDTAHTPSLAYVPYLITGDHYYQEELAFWVNWAITGMTNSSWRHYEKTYIADFQDRGQAWQLRELGRAVAFLPKDSPYKSILHEILNNNIDFYNKKYVNNPPNEYGALSPNYSYPTASPWMDDFFTWAASHLVELGFEKLLPLAQWKSKFPVQRMGYGVDGNNYCWIFGANYHLLIATEKGKPMFQTINEVYKNSDLHYRNGVDIPYGGALDSKGLPCASQEQADAKGIKLNEMVGFANAPAGFPSNMQPAIAAAAQLGVKDGVKAWNLFINRSVKPDYRTDPTWAVIPRGEIKVVSPPAKIKPPTIN